MIRGCKICGIKDPETLNFIINHPYPPKFIGLFVTMKRVQDMSRLILLKSY